MKKRTMTNREFKDWIDEMIEQVREESVNKSGPAIYGGIAGLIGAYASKHPEVTFTADQLIIFAGIVYRLCK